MASWAEGICIALRWNSSPEVDVLEVMSQEVCMYMAVLTFRDNHESGYDYNR